jgi:SAM-dependent methyltransferase
MSESDASGWTASARAWVDSLGEAGDFGRAHVLDAPMRDRLRIGRFRRMVDIGCGEGRFCRIAQAEGIETTGLDPTAALLDLARQRDPGGLYLQGRAEALPLEDDMFDLAVFCLSLIDIPDLDRALDEALRVLAPGGALLIANLNPFTTAAQPLVRIRDAAGQERRVIERYFEERGDLVSWRGISVVNHHRPMARDMQALLSRGFELVHFDEPRAVGADPARAARYDDAPWFHLMEWRKPVAF